MRDEASLAQHMVVHEALALLIGQLHRASLVDADRLARDLMQTLTHPTVASLVPGLKGQGEALVERVQHAARQEREPAESRPADR